jgi:hypothetical protein
MSGIAQRSARVVLVPLFWITGIAQRLILPPADLLRRLRDYLMPVLKPTRGVLLLVVLYSAALVLSDQGRELVYSLDLDGPAAFERWFVMVLAAVWTATQAWWWARVQIEHDEFAWGVTNPDAPPPNSPFNPWPVAWIPRIYAFAIFAAPALACIFPTQLVPDQNDPSWSELWGAWLSQSHWGSAIAFLAMGLAMLKFLSWRRRKVDKAGQEDANWFMRLLANPTRIKNTKVAGTSAPGLFDHFTRSGLAILAMSFAVAFIMLIAERIWPATIGTIFGAMPLALMGLSSMIPVIGALTIGETLSRAPVMVTLLIWMLVLSVIRPLDSHGIQPVAGSATVAQQFQTVDAALHQWESVKGNEPGQPMVLVYTAGGGIRAAYWTAALLNALEKSNPDFHKRVFAISGVSGGSVGAVFWTAALPNQDASATCAVKPDPKRTQVTEALGKDHLATAIGAWMYNDVFHAVLPIDQLIGWAMGRHQTDRAVALETSWARAFQDETGKDCLSQGFNTLWSHVGENEWRPLLLINGTHQETGRRLITSPLVINEQDFSDALDFFHLFGRDIDAATAALNSARFTYVSAAGRIDGPVFDKDGKPMLDSEGKTQLVEKGHVLDGGYFENYGARTIRDLMVDLDRLQAGRAQRHPIVLVEIVNDTDLSTNDQLRVLTAGSPPPTNEAPAPSWLGYGLINEVTAPIQGLMNVRGAHGIVEAKLAARNFESMWHTGAKWPDGWPVAFGPTNAPIPFKGGLDYRQLRLCPVHPIPPLGWVLGNSAATMDKLIDGTASSPCNIPKTLDAITQETKPAAP